jgi:Putative Flp pilus-assembly TadE/G-like
MATQPRGQAIVIVALGMVVLVGVVGLAIDGGRLFLERRQAQGAADHAALTMAQSFCAGESLMAAQADALASAATNGYDDDGVTNDVTITQPATDRFRVRVSVTSDTAFVRVLGISTFQVAAAATTGCAPGGPSGPGAVYAGGSNCNGGKYAFDVSGQTSRVYGGVHANSDVNIGGEDNQFTDHPIAPPDPFTYSGALLPSLGEILTKDNTFEPGYPQYVLPTGAWAPGWGPSDITPTMLQAYRDLADANGTTDSNDTLFTTKVTSITKDGVYYTTSTEGFEVGSATGIRNVVLVAPNGPITISGSSGTYRPYEHADLPRDGILMLAGINRGTEKCFKQSIILSGGSMSWNGILWGPSGQIEFSGSSSTSFNGSLVGHAVKLNGSDLTIFYDDSYFTTEEDIVVIE